MRKRRSLGPGFLDEVNKITYKRGNSKKVLSSDDWKDGLLPNFDLNASLQIPKDFWRVTIFLIFCITLFFILFLRLFHLQIIKGKENQQLADGNRIQIKLIHAPRGVIYDRNGKVLAANSPAFRLVDKDIKKIRLITRDQALNLEVNNDPRVKDLEVDNVRSYPYGEKLAHVLGYVGEISQDQYKSPEFVSYHLGDRIGKDGIEKEYEKVLRGVDGGEIIEVNSIGAKIRTLRTNAPTPGQNIYLNLDADLQIKIFQLTKEAAERVGSCCAAAVAQDPSNGQILALVSLPSFDPNVFTKNEDELAISEIFSNPNSPILNRSIAGSYPPGSTFKIVSSLAALISGKISPNTVFEDNGSIYLGPYKFSNWYFNEYGKVEGPVNLLKAIQRSNDIYYYEMSQVIGKDAIIDMAKKLKMGGKLNIDLPGEVNGLIPDDAWKRKTIDEVWFPGDTLHLAIGQGYVLATPLQILEITSFIGQSGIIYQPQMVNKITSQNTVVLEFKPKVLVSNLIASDKINIVKEGLKLVPKNGGTAWPFFTFPIPTAGKTGTAEYGDPKGKTHAWYTSYASATSPKSAMTVLVEGGGEGSNVSAPITKEAYRWYFSEDKNKLIQDVYGEASESGRILGE